MSWLASHGIEATQSVNKQWIQFDTEVQHLESLLQTKYHEFEHSETGEVHVACDEYHVPSHITEHVDYITPGIKLARPMKRHIIPDEKKTLERRENFYLPPIPDPSADTSNTTTLAHITTCDYHITPRCVKLLYNITVNNVSVPGNNMGIFEDLGDILDQKDLNLFWQEAYPTIPKGTGPIVHRIDGAPGLTNVTNGGGESTLDFEVIYSLWLGFRRCS